MRKTKFKQYILAIAMLFVVSHSQVSYGAQNLTPEEREIMQIAFYKKEAQTLKDQGFDKEAVLRYFRDKYEDEDGGYGIEDIRVERQINQAVDAVFAEPEIPASSGSQDSNNIFDGLSLNPNAGGSFDFSSIQNTQNGSTPSPTSTNSSAGPVQFDANDDEEYDILSQSEESEVNPNNMNNQTAAGVACRKVLAARTAAGVRKKRSIMDMYKQTIGQRMEQLAKNCKNAIFNLRVPYVNFSASGIINGLFGIANQVCARLGQAVQKAQNEAVSGLNGSLPFGIAQSGTRTQNIDDVAKKGWNPSVKLENVELNNRNN